MKRFYNNHNFKVALILAPASFVRTVYKAKYQKRMAPCQAVVPLISGLTQEAEATNLQGQPGIQNKLQDSQSYTKKSVSQTNKQNNSISTERSYLLPATLTKMKVKGFLFGFFFFNIG